VVTAVKAMPLSGDEVSALAPVAKHEAAHPLKRAKTMRLLSVRPTSKTALYLKT
jgi:hypothetical protein